MQLNLPPQLETKLAQFRRRVWIVKLTEAVLAALFGLILSYLLVYILDRLMETPDWLRLTLLSLGTATLGIGLPLKWHTWVWRQRSLEDAARLLRRTFPRLGDQLLGIVELAHAENATAGRSERLVQAAMTQTAEAIKDKDFSHAVPNARHRQWAWAVGALSILLASAYLFTNAAAENAFARWLTPWRSIQRFTFTRVETLPDRLVVPISEPFELPIQLSKTTQRSPATGSARIAKQPAITSAWDTDTYHLNFPAQKTDSTLALYLGDFRQTIQLLPRPRPELSELTVHIRLPKYLGYKSEQRIDVHGGAVNVVKGAEAGVEAKASRPLAVAQMDELPQTVDSDKFRTNFTRVDTDTTRRLLWRDLDGLSPRDPLLLKLHAVDDEAPRIAARRDSLEQVVLDSEVVTFELASTDDFGVKTLGLEWVGSAINKESKLPIRGEKITAAGEPEKRELAVRATFCAKREGLAPQTLEIRAWVDDFLPQRKRSYSATFVLHILNQSDHALWLTEQFGKWLEASKESYDREQQLHQSNQELRVLSPSELDRPENRRKVTQQAASESGNASRLEQLTQTGRSLVEQATKNPEFEAERLESWATMLKTLKEIAAARMPSVADLLKQTANASTNGRRSNGDTPPAAPGSASTQAPNSAPKVEQGAPLPTSPAITAASPDLLPKPPVPSIADRESGFSKPADSKPADLNTPPKPPGASKLGLPQTTLAAAPEQKKPDDSAPQSPAQQKMEAAITEQKDLLAEFAKVSSELTAILSSLEASTFVKRFKAASREQMKMAQTVRQKTLDSFGIERAQLPESTPIVLSANEQSKFVRQIQDDLDAYTSRKSDNRFKTILEQMRKSDVARSLNRNAEKLLTNLSGQTLSGSEFWADTLDRWAEELVSASKCKSSSCCSKESLPPEIVLKVMQALRDEMKLRDQTRELENTKTALEAEEFTKQAQTLAQRQSSISVHTQGARSDILQIADGATKFPKEVHLLELVIEVMEEAKGILRSAEAGAPAIGAETEAIELLLQAKRSSPKGGGGGGAAPGGGGRAATASASALSDLGPGADAQTLVSARPVGQATGHAGKEFPAEFKSGLDSYFNQLERGTK